MNESIREIMVATVVWSMMLGTGWLLYALDSNSSAAYICGLIIGMCVAAVSIATS